MKIGFIGLGNMGQGMAARLIAAGHELTLYNRTRTKAEGLVRGTGARARVAISPHECAEGAEAIVSMLADDAAVDAALFGAGGAFSSLAPGAVHVSMSTISVALSERLQHAHARAGHRYLAAPVFGRPDAAAAGQLAIVVAGEDTALASCRPLFEAMGRATFPFGTDAPKANVVKLSGNFLIANVIQSLGEAMALVRKAGIDPDAFLSLLTSTLFGAPVYQGYGGRIAKGNYQAEAGFAMPLALKDMRLAMEAATAQQVPMPTLAVIWQRILAAEARGYGGLDWSALGLLAAEDAGLPDSAPA